jgi:hypothetical protein
MHPKPDNHYNVSRFDSSLGEEFARYFLVPGGPVPSLDGGCILCVSLFLCSPLFTSSLLPRPVQLALLHPSLRLRLRPRSPAPSTSSSSRRYFVRSWHATGRPRVSGSETGSSATLIASNVIVLSADLRQPKPFLGKPWEGISFRLRPRSDWAGNLAARAPWLLYGVRDDREPRV